MISRQNMKKFLVLSLAITFAETRSMHAEMIQAQTLLPALNPSYVFTEDALMDQGPKNPERQHPKLFFQAEYHFLNDALVELTADRSSRIGTLVNNIHALELGSFVQPYRDFSLGVTTSVAMVSPTNGGAQTALGDSRVLAKFRLLGPDKSPFSIAFIPELRLPTGTRSLFMTNDSVGFGGLIAVERDFGDFRISGNTGYRNASNAVFQNIDYRQQVPLALGMLYSFNDQWALDVEGVGALSFPPDNSNNPAEIYAGIRHAMTPDAAWVAGLGVGSWDGNGAGNLRAVVGIKLTPATWVADKTQEAEPAPAAIAPSASPSPAASPSPTPVVIARDGRDGRDGCGKVERTPIFSARPLTDAELKKWSELPYVSTLKTKKGANFKHKIDNLNIGQSNQVTPFGFDYVRDANVVFAIDVNGLPPSEAVTQLQSAQLKMHVRKLSVDGYLNTELFCLMNDKICSGKLYEDKLWQDNINGKFFGKRKPVNQNFNKKYLNHELGKVAGHGLYTGEISMSLTETLEGSGTKNIEVIYGKSNLTKTKPATNTLYFVVSDDTFVSNDARLELNLEEDTCKTQDEQSKPATAPADAPKKVPTKVPTKVNDKKPANPKK